MKKNKLLLLILLLLFVSSTAPTVNGKEVDTSTKGGIVFSVEDTELPNTGKPSKPGGVGKIPLPQTNETIQPISVLVGIGILMGTSVIISRRKKSYK